MKKIIEPLKINPDLHNKKWVEEGLLHSRDGVKTNNNHGWSIIWEMAKPFVKNLLLLGTSYGFGFFFFGFYWIAYSLTFDNSFKFLIPFALILIPLFLSLFFSLPIMLVGSLVDKNLSSILSTQFFTVETCAPEDNFPFDTFTFDTFTFDTFTFDPLLFL